MPRKRKAADAELPVEEPNRPPPAEEELAPPPTLPNDALDIIFSFFAADWSPPPRTPQDVANHLLGTRRGALEKSALQTLRLVCRQWMRVAGLRVRRLVAPPYEMGAIALGVAFPRVTRIRTGYDEFRTNDDLAQFECVLADYAARSIKVCVEDARHPPGPQTRMIDAHGHYGMRYCQATGDKFNMRNAAFPVPAWPSMRDPTRVYATFLESTNPLYYGYVLARADAVEFDSLRVPVSGARFRASAILFRNRFSNDWGGYYNDPFPLDLVCALLVPSRWVDGRLPAVHIMIPISGSVRDGVEYVVRIRDALAPTPVVIHVFDVKSHPDYGSLSVSRLSDFYDEHQ